MQHTTQATTAAWHHRRGDQQHLVVPHVLWSLSLLHCEANIYQVQVSNSQDSSAVVRLARVLALDAEKYRTRTTSGIKEQQSGSSFMTPPAGVAQKSAQVSSESASQISGHQQSWEDDAAYLAPALAFNLNLQHELWPLMPQLRTDALTDRQSLTDVQVGKVTNSLAEGQAQRSSDHSLIIKPLRLVPDVQHVNVPQSGTAHNQTHLCN